VDHESLREAPAEGQPPLAVTDPLQARMRAPEPRLIRCLASGSNLAWR
jgi:hypothetical protein